MNKISNSSFSLLITLLISSHVIAQIAIVSPNDRATTEGSTSNSISEDAVGMPARLQYLHKASDFSALPAGGSELASMEFRLDSAWNSAVTVHQPATEIRISTTSVNSLSRRYADNIGEDELVVLSGDTTTVHPAPTTTPRAFSSGFIFDEPFHYDPSKGNLLVDLTFNGGFSTADYQLDAHETPGSISTVGDIGTASASVASLAGESVLVRRFNFVPEPGGSLLTTIGCLALLTLRRRRSD